MVAGPFSMRLMARLPLPLAHGLGFLLGSVLARLPNRHRRITERNLELCFPQASDAWRRRVTRRSLIEAAKTLAEAPRVWLAPGEQALGLIRRVSGEQHVREALQRGKGVIAVSPHLGDWELCGLYLSAHYGITSLYRPPRTRQLEAVIRDARERMGAHLVPTDPRGIRALFQAMRQGRMIGILPDQDPRESGGAFAPFFGIAANTMTLLPRLAQKSGAAVVFCYAERLSWGRGFHLRFLPGPQGIGDGDLEVGAAAVNRGVEQCVRALPEQYQWSYKRFRTRPPGAPDLYR